MKLLSAPSLTLVAGLAALLTLGPPDSPVADAAMRDDVQAVEQLLGQGADVNAPRGDGMTALHWAAENGNAELAGMLIYAGANLDAVTRIGSYTPLHVASREGQAGVVRSLLEAGADSELRAANSGATALHLASAAGDVATVSALVDHGADVDAREFQWGQTPLVFAAGWNRSDAIRTLLEAGADPDLATDVVDLEQQEDVLQAADARRDEILSTFIGKDEEREPTPSELKAAVEASRQIIRSGELPEEPKEDPRDRFRGPPTILKKGGLTPLLHAVRQGYMESMQALVEGGADVNKVSESDGTSPLLLATINGQFDAAAYLLEQGADPNLAATLNEVTPLWAAINSQWQPRTRYPQPQERGLQELGYLEIMELLLDAGADPDARISMHPWYLVYTGCGNGNCGLVDMQGSTAFWRAAYATDVAAMELLTEYGADPHLPTKAGNMMDFDDYRRLQVLEALGDEFEGKEQEGKAQALRMARDELPDSLKELYPDSVLNENPDDFHDEVLAAWEHQDSVTQAEPDPSGLEPVEEGDPAVYPIHAASGVGYGEGFAGNAHRHVPDAWMEAVRYLVEEVGADVNARDANGYTAVHHAASRGDNEMIRYLVELGADVTVVSRDGETTADMANGPVQRVSPFPETVALLETLGSDNNHNCQSC